MWQWLRCLFGRHESDCKLYPWNWYTRNAVSRCRHCGAIVSHDLSREEFERLFHRPDLRKAL